MPRPLRGQDDAERSDYAQAQGRRHATTRSLVHEEKVRPNLDGKAQRFAFPCTQVRSNHERGDGRRQASHHDPRGERHAREDLPRHGGGHGQLPEHGPEKLELADLLKGDERTRVRYHHGAHSDSLAAFSAAHSSSVISR